MNRDKRRTAKSTAENTGKGAAGGAKGTVKETVKDVVKPDAVLKEFWRDNERFADLFNGALFEGRPVIRPETLEESDTDLSAVLKLNGHGETLQRILDVAKRSRDGVDYVLLGLENQQQVHYGMPLRIMEGDVLGYRREYQELSRKNRAAGKLKGSGVYLSRFHKEDRLHPMVTICVYYGEVPWDGPMCLRDMLKIPPHLEGVVNDYRMHLVQVRDSDGMLFHNQDVRTVFEVSRNIYRKEYEKLQDTYQGKEIDSELGLVIGAITESKELINQALEKKGGQLNMCRALEELKQEGVQEGMDRGIQIGIQTGMERGALLKLKQLTQTRLAKGKTAAQIAEDLEESEQVIQRLIKEINKE